ncbi:MAG TPA: DUF354 domain-containing protein [Patescibacteria group bacterium]|nr:DUF354 domain-containing protein [Patescibacteria group bacterium]
MNIWIDLSNSPHVLFFRPIILELQKRGHRVTVTSRDYAQTNQLADLYAIQHTPIGVHGGKKLYEIALRVVDRTWKLMRFARGKKFDLAVNHGSYSQSLAAFALRVPFVTLDDYEYSPASPVMVLSARRIIVPIYFPDWALRKYGAPKRKIVYYHGVKEQMYLADFIPQENYLASVGIPADRIVVVMRPPATWTLYHHFENPLFERALEFVVNTPFVYIVFLPRIPSQGDSIQTKGYPNVWIPSSALDGPNLLHYSDVVISGGGSMNREAAVLGTPTYSLFKGKLAAVDSYLIGLGRMKHITEENDIPMIEIVKKEHQSRLSGENLVMEVADAILG